MENNKSTPVKLQRTSVSEQIFAILKQKIASGEWQDGQKIPSENELAAQFGVSRMSARSALQRLSALGLLETRPGDGTFVRAFSLLNYFQEATDLIATSNNMEQIREFRNFFESDCVRLACARRSRQDIEELKAIWQRMQSAAEAEDFDGFFEADMDFHDQICAMTGNELFQMVNSWLRNLMMPQLKFNTMNFARIRGCSLDHEAPNYVLRVLTEEHQDYIHAIEQQQPQIALKNMPRYFGDAAGSQAQ